MKSYLLEDILHSNVIFSVDSNINLLKSQYKYKYRIKMFQSIATIGDLSVKLKL